MLHVSGERRRSFELSLSMRIKRATKKDITAAICKTWRTAGKGRRDNAFGGGPVEKAKPESPCKSRSARSAYHGSRARPRGVSAKGQPMSLGRHLQTVERRGSPCPCWSDVQLLTCIASSCPITVFPLGNDLVCVDSSVILSPLRDLVEPLTYLLLHLGTVHECFLGTGRTAMHSTLGRVIHEHVGEPTSLFLSMARMYVGDLCATGNYWYKSNSCSWCQRILRSAAIAPGWNFFFLERLLSWKHNFILSRTECWSCHCWNLLLAG